MPFVDVEVREGTVTPAQIVSDVPKLKAGIIFCTTVTARVAGIAHNPASGVKV